MVDIGGRRDVFGGVSDSQARIWSREAIRPPRRSLPLGGIGARGGGKNESGMFERALAGADPGAAGGGGTVVGVRFCKRGGRLEKEGSMGREDGTAPAVAGLCLPRNCRMLPVRCEGERIVSTATACSDVLFREVTGRNRTALARRDAKFSLASHMLIADNAVSCGASFEVSSSTRNAWVEGGLLAVAVIESAREGVLLGSEA